MMCLTPFATSRRHSGRLCRPQTSQGAGIANGEVRRQTIRSSLIRSVMQIGGCEAAGVPFTRGSRCHVE
jgi:hypothetical protein